MRHLGAPLFWVWLCLCDAELRGATTVFLPNFGVPFFFFFFKPGFRSPCSEMHVWGEPRLLVCSLGQGEFLDADLGAKNG